MKNRREFKDKSSVGSTPFKEKKPTELRSADIYPVRWIYKAVCDDEIYQAYHRNRGLRYPRIIFAYGWFPRVLDNEFKIISIPDKEKKEEELWKELIKKEELSPEEIERRKLIKKMIEMIESKAEERGLTIDDIIEKDRIGIVTPIAKEFGLWEKEEREWIKNFIKNYYKIKQEIRINKKK